MNTTQEFELRARLRALTVSPQVMGWKSTHHGFVALCLAAVHFALLAFSLDLVAWAVAALALLEALRCVRWAWRSLVVTVRRLGQRGTPA